MELITKDNFKHAKMMKLVLVLPSSIMHIYLKHGVLTSLTYTLACYMEAYLIPQCG